MKEQNLIELSVYLKLKNKNEVKNIELLIKQYSHELWKTFVQYEFKDEIRLSVYSSSSKEANAIKKILADLKKPSFKIDKRNLEKEEWFDSSLEKKNFKLGKSFTLSFEKEHSAFSRQQWIRLLPSGDVFGDGQHPSTQIAVELMERIQSRFESVLDIGTGTGILSLVAYRCGAKEIFAIDNSKKAILQAKENFLINGLLFPELKRIPFEKLKAVKLFDLVIANLPSPIIIKNAKQMIRRIVLGGYVIFSGIHISDLKDTQEYLRDKKLRCLRIIKKRGWCGLLFKRIG